MKEKSEKKDVIFHKYPLVEFNRIRSYIQKLLCKKYFKSRTSYQKDLIKNIIYDDRTRLVANFKEQLIINDTSEYCKRYYRMKESIVRLNNFFEIYEEFSKIFPNYTPLVEAKYLYINIHRKQKIIDLQQDQDNWKVKLKRNIKNRMRNNKIFNNEVYESIEKNSEKINSEIFDINKDELNDSILQIKNIINNIDKYELNFENIDFSLNKKHRKKFKTKNNIIINNYYYNNNSILTKKINLATLLIQPKNNFINGKNFSFIKNNILTNLKKPRIITNYYKVKNKLYSQLNKTKPNESKNIKNMKYVILENNFVKKNSSKYKNKSVINSITNSKRISNHISFGKNNLRINKLKKETKKNSNIVANTSRIYNYQNIKLINIIKKITNFDSNKSYNKKYTSNLNNKNKIKINRSLISKIMNNKNSELLSDRTINNLDSQKKIDKQKIKITINKTTREKSKNDELKIYLETIKKNGNKKSMFNKFYGDKKIIPKHLNFGLKTDRGIYYLNKINKSKKNNISKKSKEDYKTKNENINKKNYISNSFLTNENIIKNKHKRKNSDRKSVNTTKYISININELYSKNKNMKDSKNKIKGIQIKNFSKIFNTNKEQTNESYIKTSERRNIKLKIPKNINNKLSILKNKFIKKNNLISYTEREKAKRLFFSNNK